MAAGLASTALGCARLADLTAPGAHATPDPARGELASRERLFDDLVDRLADPGHEPSGRVVLSLSLTGGWQLPVPIDERLAILDDGQVVSVTDTSVFSSTHDYTTMRLSQRGLQRVLEIVRPLLPARRADLDGGAGVSPTDRSAWLEVGDGITLSMDRIGQSDGYPPAARSWRSRFADVIERLRDLTWLGSDIVEPQSPWTPPSLTVLARAISPRSGPAPPGSSVPWPLDRTIETLATGSTLDPQGMRRLVLCLDGGDVAPVFGLLTGANRASLRVNDGRDWELDIRPHEPAYQLVGDPCG